MDEKGTQKLIAGVLKDFEKIIKDNEAQLDALRKKYEAMRATDPDGAAALLREIEGLTTRTDNIREHYLNITDPYRNIGPEVTIHLEERHAEIIRHLMKEFDFLHTPEAAILWALEVAPEEMEE